MFALVCDCLFVRRFAVLGTLSFCESVNYLLIVCACVRVRVCVCVCVVCVKTRNIRG